MLKSTEEYKKAVIADSRRVHLRAIVDLSDPDIVWNDVTDSNQAPWSKPEEIHDKNTETPPRYITLEHNRWSLGGGFSSLPDNYSIAEQIGFVSDSISDENGHFEPSAWVQVSFSDVVVLQMITIMFSNDPEDGVPEDFTVEVFSGNTAFFTKNITGNTSAKITLSDFTVNIPTEIRVTCTKTSLPFRRFRVIEIFAGLYEEWNENVLSEFSVSQQGQFSCITIPYGTATLAMDNSDRRFEPRKKDSLFQSIEERQGVELYVGMELNDGKNTVEYEPVGVFYQAGDGWKSSTNSATMKWTLVDIVGLVSNRAFIVPDTLPTTLEGWISAVMAQLGVSFKNHYFIDPNYSQKSVTAKNKEAVTGSKCGDIIRWACMATGTWPRAASNGGKLTIEPLWNEGNKITLEAMTNYPSMRANESIAALIFQLSNKSELVISGNATSSEKTIIVQNPFIHTEDQARESAKLILSCYGGNLYDIIGRGDPASEIGDVDTIWLDKSNAVTARRMSQSFEISNGVLQGCKATLLQADGSYLWTDYVILTESGQWTAPPGVTQIFIALIGGGQAGAHGDAGYVRPFQDPYTGESGNQVYAGYGKAGQNGQGGKIWYGIININPSQTFPVTVGKGGKALQTSGVPGELGGHTTFSMYSSENGVVYPNGYTDIANGLSFARTGVAAPIPGTGDGGKGGDGGDPGAGYLYQNYGDIGYRFEKTKNPGPGKPGASGANGAILIRWNKPEVE